MMVAGEQLASGDFREQRLPGTVAWDGGLRLPVSFVEPSPM